jgi:hypothetical protein
MMFRKINIALIAFLLVALTLTSCKKDEDDPADSPPASPTVNTPLHIYANYFYVNWTGVTGAEGYVVDVATDQDFTNILADYNNKEVAINGMFVVDGTNPTTSYYVRMRSFNANGISGNSSFKEFVTTEANILPNMGMENWISYPNYDSPSPDGVWTSANKVADLNPAYYPVLLFKTDDKYSGNYAAKMVTNLVVGMPLLAGSLSTGVFTVDIDNPLQSMISGVPYKSRPSRFQGYYKYMGVDGDSCEIRTTLSRWNTSEKKKDIIGEAIYRTTDLIDAYTHFDLEIVYFMSGEPDSIDMVFAASAGGEYFIGGVGSTLYVDDFKLIFE